MKYFFWKPKGTEIINKLPKTISINLHTQKYLQLLCIFISQKIISAYGKVVDLHCKSYVIQKGDCMLQYITVLYITGKECL